MEEKKIILTNEDREKLIKEYRQLIDVERPATIEKLALARSQGDLSENADYDAARERQAQIESRISDIENILNNAETFIGDEVTFREIESGETITVRIVGNVGANPLENPPKVSNESPLGVALLGHKAGDRVVVECPHPYEIEIIKRNADLK